MIVGIIGTGVGIRTHLKAFKEQDGVYVKGLSGSSYERASFFAAKNNIDVAYKDYVELCNDPEIDLVCVTSPNTLHYEHTSLAIKSGKHVLCEKPLGMNVNDCEKLIELQHQDKFYIVNHQLRFNPYIQVIRQLITENKIGKPYYCRIHQQGTAFSNRDMPWCWSFDEQQGGGVRLAMGSHLIDLVGFMYGFDFAEVDCAMDTVVDERRDSEGMIHPVTGSGYVNINTKHESGLATNLFASAAAFGESKFDISVYGDKGEIQFDLKKKLRISTIESMGGEKDIYVPNVFQDEKDNSVSIFSGSFRYFAPSIYEAFKSANYDHLSDAANFQQSLEVQKVLDASLESYRAGKSKSINGSCLKQNVNEVF